MASTIEKLGRRIEPGRPDDRVCLLDAKELGDLLESGQAALIVIRESRVEEQLDKALTRAEKSLEKEIDADSKEFERELKEAEKEATAG